MRRDSIIFKNPANFNFRKDSDMNATVTSKWTADDEARLKELEERKQRIMDEYKNPVRALTHSCLKHYLTDGGSLEVVEGVVEALIEDADRFVAALQPFTKR